MSFMNVVLEVAALFGEGTTGLLAGVPAAGEHAWTLTATDTVTGWTESPGLPNTAGKSVLAALDEIASLMPLPILGVGSDNASEFINAYLLGWCQKRQITFTRWRVGDRNDGSHVEQKNCAIVRVVAGYHRYETAAEVLLLNKTWTLRSQLTNYFYPQQKLISKTRVGAKVSKRYDRATSPYNRTEQHDTVSDEDKAVLADTYAGINPSVVQRQIQALTSELEILAASKAVKHHRFHAQLVGPTAPHVISN